MVCYDESGEQCLNRYYSQFECKEKLTMLGEYYKVVLVMFMKVS